MPEIVQQWMKPETLALSLGLACFTLPFLVFAAPAGYLADRFSKRNVMVACKAAEIVVVALGIAAILLGSVPLMFVILFILGGQAMMFITSKLGAIPEIVRSDKISAANGLINMVSMSAIIFGSVAGNWLYDLTKPAGQERWWLSASALLGVATCGLITSLFIGRLPVGESGPEDPLESGRANRPRPAACSGRSGRCSWRRWEAPISGRSARFRKSTSISSPRSTWSWPRQYVGPLLAVLTLGIGGGALLAGHRSRGARWNWGWCRWAAWASP